MLPTVGMEANVGTGDAFGENAYASELLHKLSSNISRITDRKVKHSDSKRRMMVWLHVWWFRTSETSLYQIKKYKIMKI